MHTSVWHCVAAPPLATGWPRSRSFLTARVASVKQIVIIIIKLVIIIHWGQKNQISRNLLKTMSNFFFCQAQLGINVYYREKKFKKVEKQKFKLALKLFKKSWKSRKIQKSLFFKMVDFWHFFAICILYLVFCLCICVFLSFLEQQFLSISASKYSFDDDYDDSGGRTQRDCLSLTAPDRRVSLTEAKTNTVCTWHW